MDSQVIVITGASAGIGAALARLLVSKGNRVVLSARREKELTAVAAECGEGALAVVGDMTRRADVEKLRDAAIEKFGQIDVWINNVGRGISRPVLELTDDDVDQVVAVNLKSALYGMQTIAPYFKERKRGHLINVSSFLGRVPIVTIRSIYSASKAALNVLTANLRVDLAKEFPDINISLVMPGVVLTDFHKNAMHGGTGWTPGRTGGATPGQTAEEVAEAIAELIAHPKSEIYTNRAAKGIAEMYRADFDGFETGMRERG